MQNKINKLIEKELTQFNFGLKQNIRSSTEEFQEVLEYIIKTRGKQIRPILGILCSNIIGQFNERQNIFLQGIELIHNATLLHDDVIDESKIRRGNIALHQKFSNKIAILTGDYFLSTAIEIIHKLKSQKINNLLAKYMKEICEGEIEQNFSAYKILPIKKYLKKTERKTALLFELTTHGCAILSENKDGKVQTKLKNVGRNFGMIFQIKDDLKNFQKKDNKPVHNDVENGIYTAPIIFLAKEFPEIKNILAQKKYQQLSEYFKKSQAITKTQNLINHYQQNALLQIKDFPKSVHKEALKELLSYFGNN